MVLYARMAVCDLVDIKLRSLIALSVILAFGVTVDAPSRT